MRIDEYKFLLKSNNIEKYKDYMVINTIFEFISESYFSLTSLESHKILKFFLLLIQFKEIFPHNSLKKKLYSFSTEYVEKIKLNAEYFRESNNYNFLIEKFDFPEEIIKDLKIKQKSLLEIFKSIYFFNHNFEQEEETFVKLYYNNKYLQFFHLISPEKTFKKSSFFSNTGITFRFFLNGDVYYKDKFICCENSSLVTGKNIILGDFCVLSQEFEEIIFEIKDSFFLEFNLEIPKIKILEKKFYFNRENLSFLNNLQNSNLLDLSLFKLATDLVYWILSPDEKYVNFNYDISEKKEMILNLINENILNTEDKILNILLKNLDVSQTKLYYLFEKYFNETPAKIINRERIKKSLRYLLISSSQIENIVDKVGFTSKTTYVNNFKNIYHISPSNLRKNINSKLLK